MNDDLTDRLRRCVHHTMRVRGEPCAHWECVARNEAADRIEELEAALREAVKRLPPGVPRDETMDQYFDRMSGIQ